MYHVKCMTRALPGRLLDQLATGAAVDVARTRFQLARLVQSAEAPMCAACGEPLPESEPVLLVESR
jgi:hypothetical protein